ncbi:MAG: LemA family protein, partial [Eubacteriales bacterium]|nr:LemA family protein [Eubacteriales bacterium]
MLYVILGIIMIFWAWMQAAMGKLQKYKKEAREQWVRVDALLQSRSRYILELLELADEKGLDTELLAEIYELGGGWCSSDDREIIRACAENVTPLVDRLLLLAMESSLKEEEAFLELESSLTELEEEIEVQSSRYNHFIDRYNEHRENPGIRLQ